MTFDEKDLNYALSKIVMTSLFNSLTDQLSTTGKK